jgi:hypothetical protein
MQHLKAADKALLIFKLTARYFKVVLVLVC